MKEYDVYLFDADGTLLDTKGPILAAFQEMGRALGAELPPAAEITGTIGLPLYKQLRAILGEGRDEEFYAEAGRIYGDALMARYRESLRVFPGVATGLRELKEMGKKLAVVSSRRLFSLEAFLSAMDIGKYFDLLVTPENTAKHKPDPEPALYAAKEFGAGPEICVFIGDAVFDIQCGKAAGMDAVLVSWGGMSPEGWDVRPDAVVDEFQQLLPDRPA